MEYVAKVTLNKNHVYQPHNTVMKYYGHHEMFFYVRMKQNLIIYIGLLSTDDDLVYRVNDILRNTVPFYVNGEETYPK